MMRGVNVPILDQVLNKAWVAYNLTNAGIIRPTRPDKLARIALTLQRWGPTPAAGYTAAAIRFGNEVGIIDELGTLILGPLAEVGQLLEQLGPLLFEGRANVGECRVAHGRSLPAAGPAGS